jgi:hypothetical protein
MVGSEVKQTRCATCDAEHEYKHARVPRQRRKQEPAFPLSATGEAGIKRAAAASDGPANPDPDDTPLPAESDEAADAEELVAASDDPSLSDDESNRDADVEDGPVHRALIRATLPRPEGQPPSMRPGPDFTIRHPLGRANRFRPRHQRDSSPYGNRSNGNVGGPMRSGHRQSSGRPPLAPRPPHRRGPGRKRSK